MDAKVVEGMVVDAEAVAVQLILRREVLLVF
jgi:hypothetical protein